MELFHFHNDHGELSTFFAALTLLPILRMYVKTTWSTWTSKKVSR
jgi:hypothetical protein